MLRFIGFAVDVIVAEKAFFAIFIVTVRQADDDDVDVGLASRVRTPTKGAMGELDF